MSDVMGMDALTSWVRESSVSGVERHALLLRMDLLPASLARPVQLRRARQALDPLFLADRGRAYELESGRVVISWRGDAPALLQQTYDGLDQLLQEDPFEAPGLSQLVELFDLPTDADWLIHQAEHNVVVRPDRLPQNGSDLVFEAPDALRPLDAHSLERLEQGLALTDMSRFARRKPVCHSSSQGMQLAWEERTLSIPELIDTVAPGHDAKSDPWLFRRLTRVLDRRMLSILSDPQELRRAGPFSLTLNAASVLGPEFLRFDMALPAGLRNRVVISLLPADIVSDAAAFAFARNFARARSYRICLRAVSAALLPALDFAALELDYVQLAWSPELHDINALPDIAGARWIMGRPCTRDAIRWGKRAGIGLFATIPGS